VPTEEIRVRRALAVPRRNSGRQGAGAPFPGATGQGSQWGRCRAQGLLLGDERYDSSLNACSPACQCAVRILVSSKALALRLNECSIGPSGQTSRQGSASSTPTRTPRVSPSPRPALASGLPTRRTFFTFDVATHKVIDRTMFKLRDQLADLGFLLDRRQDPLCLFGVPRRQRALVVHRPLSRRARS
jgi:hypothetical protein